MHLVGDIHQPLHATALFTTGVFSDADGDRGGNQIEIDGSTLHAYWDNLLGNPNTFADIGAIAADVMAEFEQHGPAAAACMDTLHWAQESHQLAKEAVYTKEVVDAVVDRDDEGGQTIAVSLPPDYGIRAGLIARQRAVEGGFRLARAIEEVVQGIR
jgi:hypothetical protein